MSSDKIKVEIWSDVVCPFCYLGKRRFEQALESFSGRDRVEIIWKSFQLAPHTKTDPTITIYESLARDKGFPEAQARQMTANIVPAAQEFGLAFNFDDIVVANTFRAHCLLHFAADHQRQHDTKEALLNAYFTRGINIDDVAALMDIAATAGLDATDFLNALEQDTYVDAVTKDIQEARQMGIRGVPFFVLNRQLAISGAQPPDTFVQALQQLE